MQVNFNCVHYFYHANSDRSNGWLHEFFEMSIEIDPLKCNEQVRSLSFWIGEEGSYDE